MIQSNINAVKEFVTSRIMFDTEWILSLTLYAYQGDLTEPLLHCHGGLSSWRLFPSKAYFLKPSYGGGGVPPFFLFIFY